MSDEDVTLYHNPRCGTSRRALELIRERGVEPRVIEYLIAPPSGDEFRSLLAKLKLTPREVMRTKDALYRELGLDDPALSNDALIEAIAANPALLQRPIAVRGDRAALGRPAENVLEVL